MARGCRTALPLKFKEHHPQHQSQAASQDPQGATAGPGCPGRSQDYHAPPSLSSLRTPRGLGSLLPVPRVALPISRGRSSEASGDGRGVRAAWQIPSERQGGARPSPSGSLQDQVSASRRPPGGMG